jgi:sRNA-binding regulator protein Hfq
VFSKTTNMTEEQRLQIEEGKRLAREESNVHSFSPRSTLTARQKPVIKKPTQVAPLKGHEAFLKALETTNARITVEKCDGSIIKGTVKHSDHFTISIRCETGKDRVVFKHDISEFSATPAVKPAAQPDQTGA